MGREICKDEEVSGADGERRRPEVVPLPPASWMALEPPVAAREPDAAREMVGIDVEVLEEREWLKEVVWWREGALEVSKPERLRAVDVAEEREELGIVVARGWDLRYERNSS